MNKYQKGIHMDLLTYAVSRKLLNDNDMWRYIANGEPIPQTLVEDAFKDVLETHTDVVAERLTTDYDSFVSHHVPVTFTTNTDGVDVSGEIDDNALEIINVVHDKTVDDVIRQTVTSSIHTISPEREFTISDIETMASELMARTLANHEVVHANKLVVDIVDDAPGIYESDTQTQTKAHLEDAMNQLNELEHQYNSTSPVNTSQIEDSSFDIPTLDDEPIHKEVVENLEAQNTDTGLMSSVWNSFVSDIREHKLDERLELTTPLVAAL